MIKNLLFTCCFMLGVFGSIAQCTDDYDWGDETFGVSPDPENGETFEDGVLNEDYAQTIYLLVPETASDINSEFLALPIDSAVLVNVKIIQDGNEYTTEEFGLSLTCNNGGTSSDPCTFQGGQTGCGLLSGIPLLPGEFDITIEALVYITLGGPISQEFNYDGYTIFIDQIGSTSEVKKEVSEVRVSPNPFTSKALVQFESLTGGVGEFTVMNLLGEVKYEEVLSVKKGFNKIQISSADLDSGVYLYHLEVGDFNVTKRLVVNK